MHTQHLTSLARSTALRYKGAFLERLWILVALIRSQWIPSNPGRQDIHAILIGGLLYWHARKACGNVSTISEGTSTVSFLGGSSREVP